MPTSTTERSKGVFIAGPAVGLFRSSCEPIAMGAIYRLGATGKQFAAKPDMLLQQSPAEKA
jgi:hypothetical protein